MLTVVIALLSPLALHAQPVKPSTAGYVVKVDGKTVYLDLGEGTGAAAGRGFEVYTEGEVLKHPVTGATLGSTQNVLAAGKITQVQPLFSIGTLDQAEGVKPGQRARLAAPMPAPAPAPSVGAASAAAGLRAPRAKSPTFDFPIRGFALGDFSGAGQNQLALASSEGVTLYPYPPVDAKPTALFKVPGSAPRVLSLEAADLDGDGRAELFLSLYSETLGRVETLVLAVSTAGLTQTADLPFLTRSMQDPKGKVILASQQLVDDATFPFGAVLPVVWNDGKYALGKTAIPHKRADWLWSFTHADIDGQPAMVYLTSTDHLRLQFEGSNYYKTRDPFGQTPIRLRWPAKDAGKLLEFHPRMRAAKVGGKSVVYAVRNISMLGSLSEPFGLFNSGEIKRLSWNGVALEEDFKGELGGYATGLELAPSAADPRDLVVAVSGTSGKSSIWIFDP